MNNLVKRVSALWHLFIKELMKFGVVGAAAWVLNASVVWLLMHTQYFTTSHIKAKFVATILAIIFSWIANRMWTFRDKRQADKRKEAFQFIVANGIGLAIEMGCLGVSIYVLGLTSATASFISGTVLGTVLGTIFRYFAYRFWVFSTELDQDPEFADSTEEELAFVTGQLPVVPRHTDSRTDSGTGSDDDVRRAS